MLCFVLRFHLVDLNKLCEAQLSQSTSTRAWSDAARGLVAGRAARPAASLSLQLHLNHSRAHALAELCFVLRFHLVDLNKLCEAQLSQSISTRAWSDAAGGLVAGRAARAAQTCSVPCISPPAAEITPISDHKEFE